jgi:hypothetical protein
MTLARSTRTIGGQPNRGLSAGLTSCRRRRVTALLGEVEREPVAIFWGCGLSEVDRKVLLWSASRTSMTLSWLTGS